MLILSRIPQHTCVEFEEFQKKVGKRIQVLRENAGITQEKMEEGEFGISYRTLQDIEGGRSNVTLLSLFKIAKRLHVKPKDLLDI